MTSTSARAPTPTPPPIWASIDRIVSDKTLPFLSGAPGPSSGGAAALFKRSPRAPRPHRRESGELRFSPLMAACPARGYNSFRTGLKTILPERTADCPPKAAAGARLSGQSERAHGSPVNSRKARRHFSPDLKRRAHGRGHRFHGFHQQDAFLHFSSRAEFRITKTDPAL